VLPRIADGWYARDHIWGSEMLKKVLQKGAVYEGAA
jgi:hypothetical protein